MRLPDDIAKTLRQDSEEKGVALSLHAPYYISMSSMKEETRLNSLTYIRQSAEAVRKLGGNRIIIHTGSAGQQTREEALEKAADTLTRARTMLDEEGFEDIYMCPETMGKINQLGTLEEVLALCRLDEKHIPCVDFGHLNARTHGAIKTKEDYAAMLDTIEQKIGAARAKTIHVHFSKIEYSEGGEKRHLTLEDTEFGPDYKPLLELFHERRYTPTIICESAGTQAEDAKIMMTYYNSL